MVGHIEHHVEDTGRMEVMVGPSLPKQLPRTEELMAPDSTLCGCGTELHNAVIVDVCATRLIRTAEVGAAQTMVKRTEDRFGIKPDWLVADAAYGSAENLAWLVKKREIIPFIPLIDRSERTDGTFSRSEFEWDRDNDRYTCAEGHHLMITQSWLR